jgi:tagaturonate epimerase
MSDLARGAADSAPKPEPLGLAPSFGFGDRLGLATPGHVAALRASGGSFLPIFAQQSIREMTRTNRSPEQVMSDALRGAASAGYTGRQGADADHLKTLEDVDVTAAAGFVFFTVDPSDYVDAQADDYDAATLATRFRAVRDEVAWTEAYVGRSIPLSGGRGAAISETECRRAAVKYGRAVNHVVAMARRAGERMSARGQDYEVELSVDETTQPTSPAEHFICASECLKQGVKLISLAPRFVGDFEKGVDYKGDIGALERHAADHAAIAAALGPYKLSLHSGSDKLSIYPTLSRLTCGMVHVKTAGTSYLEALRVVVRHEPRMFREIVDFSRARYDHDKASYHVSARLADAPPQSEIHDDVALEDAYLGLWSKQPPLQGLSNPGRQIVHCTFGSVLTDARLGPAIRDVLVAHADTYEEVLAFHFAKHLDALESGLRS